LKKKIGFFFGSVFSVFFFLGLFGLLGFSVFLLTPTLPYIKQVNKILRSQSSTYLILKNESKKKKEPKQK
jgi:hypothetical protein